MNGRRVTIIGGGLSGLAAGLWLRGAGCEVTVVEALDRPGGMVRTEELSLPGKPSADHSARTLCFDTGATVLTMPELIVEALGAVGIDAEDARSRLGLIPVDPTYVAQFADHTSLAVPGDPTKIAAQARRDLGPAAARGVDDLLKWLEDLYDAEFGTFINRNFHHPGELADPRTLGAARRLVRMGALGHLSDAVGRFVDDERLQKIFTFQALYAGMAPHKAPAVYGVIAHMDIGNGVHHPIGGIGRVGAVMADALRAAGASIHLDTRATGILRSSKRVTGVKIVDAEGHGRILTADSVIATTPVAGVAELLGGPVPRGRRWRRVRYSPSAVVVHGFVPRTVTADWPGHHHFLSFGSAWESTFEELTTRPGRLMRDPSFLITRPAYSDPVHYADNDYEAVSVLAPCPNLDVAPLDWPNLVDPYIAEFLETLHERGLRGIGAHLRVAKIDHPGTWAQAGLPAGTPFGAAHSLMQTGPLRTPNAWPGTTNLFLAGSTTIPGVGIPPVLVSGRLAAVRTLEWLGTIGGRARR